MSLITHGRCDILHTPLFCYTFEMDGRTIISGKTKNGKQYIIRYPKNEDAPMMLEYINVLSREQTFIPFQGEQLTLKEEQKFLSDMLNKIEKLTAVMLFLVVDDKVVGITQIDMKDRTEKHTGVLGISVAKEMRGQGMGKLMINLILQEAKRCIPNIEIVTLEVFAPNNIGLDMYRKAGFSEFGRLPKGIVYKNKREDLVYMYQEL